MERLEGPELILVSRQAGQVRLVAGLLHVEGDDDDRVAPLLLAGDEHVLHQRRPRVDALEQLGVDELAVGERPTRPRKVRTGGVRADGHGPLYSTSSRFAGIFGPLIFALVSQTAGDSRLSIVALVIFFVVGGALLLRVDEREGARAARGDSGMDGSGP